MLDTVNLKGNEEESRMEQRGPHQSRRGRWVIKAIIAIAVVLIGWWFIAGITEWKAVFLTNNQVYFGHFLSVPFAGTITLRDVYYLQFLQSGDNLDTQDQSQLKLVKLGSEIQGPTDEMVIPVSQVLFWETLRSNSAIVMSIKNGQQQTSQ